VISAATLELGIVEEVSALLASLEARMRVLPPVAIERSESETEDTEATMLFRDTEDKGFLTYRQLVVYG
jgi:hypothetical protein